MGTSLITVFLLSSIFLAEGIQLMVSHDNEIIQLDLDHTGNWTVVSADEPVKTFDIHVAWRQVFWGAGKYIFRTPLYDLSTTTLIAVTGRVGTVAVDWVHRHLYWTDVAASRIEAAHLDGTGRRVVYETERSLGALALDPLLGKVFWIESSQVGRRIKRVRSSNFDGSQTFTIYKNESIWEDSPLALNIREKKVYFYQSFGPLSRQMKIDYYGDKVWLNYQEPQWPVTSLYMVNNGYYYSSRKGVVFAHLITMKYDVIVDKETFHWGRQAFRLTEVDDELKNATQIRVNNQGAQPQRRDACYRHACQHDCVPLAFPADYTCVCQYGYSLQADELTCADDGYILYSTETTFGRVLLSGEQHTVIYDDPSSEITNFDVHIRRRLLYWVDSTDEVIYRAPIDAPSQKQVVVRNVTAYGMAVDWLYDHLYWTDHSRIMVASLDGAKQLTLLEDLNAPADIAVDPVNRYIFWSECGHVISIQRASLTGSDVASVRALETCGISLSADPATSTLYWLDWTGSVYSCDYRGSAVTRLYSDMVNAMTILDHHILWTEIDESVIRSTPRNATLFSSHFDLSTYDVRPRNLRVVRTSQQQLLEDNYNVCEDSDCAFMCFPAPNATEADCMGSLTENTVVEEETNQDNHYLELVEYSPFSLTLRCSGTLLSHPILQPFIEITEVDSLVNRENVTRISRMVQLTDKTKPFTIDALNPSTSYVVSVRNRVTRAASSMTVHTPPPPLEVQRVPLVTVPDKGEVSWFKQGIHYSSPNVWESLLQREYLLILISKGKYSLSTPIDVEQPLVDRIKSELKENFMVIRYYKTKEQFDDDPEMYLGNLPAGEEFYVAMVQATRYKTVYNLDIVLSHKFSSPDPWKYMAEKILAEQRIQ